MSHHAGPHRRARTPVQPHDLGRHPTEATDHDGQRILLVPLANHPKPARIYPEDFQRTLEAGGSPHWFINGGIVKTYGGDRNSVAVARLLIQPTEPVYIGTRDRDPLNIRRENIRVRRFRQTKTLGRPRKAADA